MRVLRPPGGELLQLGDAIPHRRQRLPIAVRRRFGPGRERRQQHELGVGKNVQLLLLLRGHEARQRHDAADLRQRPEPVGHPLRRGGVGDQHVDRVGRGDRIAHEIHERRHGLRAGVLEVQRVEIEVEPRQQRQSHDGDDARRGEHRVAPAGEEAVDRRGPGIADRLALAARLEKRQQRGQQGEVEEQGDHHAGAGDQAEFRNALVVGRQEGKETRHQRKRRQGKGPGHSARGTAERGLQVVDAMALAAVKHGVLDAEIDGDPDEQHREGDRDQVERPDRERGESSGQHQTDQQVDLTGEHQPPRPHGEIENDADEQEGADGGAARAFRDGAELLVVERHRSRLAHAIAVLGREAERRRLLAHGLAGARPRLERAEIAHRLDQNEAAAFRATAPTGQQRLPRDRLHPARDRGLDRLGHGGERRLDQVERRPALGDAVERQGERAKQSAQCGIRGEAADHRLHLDELVRQVRQLLRREEEKAVPAKERPLRRALDRGEQVLARGEARRERGCGVSRGVGGRRVDDDRQVELARKGMVVLDLRLTPRQLRRHHLGGIGVDAERAGGIYARNRRGRDGDDDDGHRVAVAELDPAHHQPAQRGGDQREGPAGPMSPGRHARACRGSAARTATARTAGPRPGTRPTEPTDRTA